MIHFNLFADKYKNKPFGETHDTASSVDDKVYVKESVAHASKDAVLVTNEYTADCSVKNIDNVPNATYYRKGSSDTTDVIPIICKCISCNISCPDERSYELHINGRKHRNRLRKLEEEERTAAALAMMENKLESSMS